MKCALPILLLIPMTIQAQIEPWVKPDSVRYMYAVESSSRIFEMKGTIHTGFAVKKLTKVLGPVQWIGGVVFRWKDTDGRNHVYFRAPTEHGFISENPHQLYVCDKGALAGWVFLKPPFVGVLIAPPPPPKAIPKVDPPPLPQMLETRYYTPAIWRVK